MYNSTPRDWPRSSHTRVTSRSSTSTSNTRLTSRTHSPSNSVSQIPRSGSPQLGSVSAHALSHANTSHRLHQATASGKPSSALASSQKMQSPSLPKEGSGEVSLAKQMAMSSFLLERLQNKRRTEEERNPSQDTLDMGSIDARSASPARVDSPGPPRSSGKGDDDGKGKKKLMGVREMEKVISTLHKQNFDLKLELYHRRERQAALEKQVEASRSEMDEMHDGLVVEMEKRDKAVEEAVGIIVTLESQREELLKELQFLRQIAARHYNSGNLDWMFPTRPQTAAPPTIGTGSSRETARNDRSRDDAAGSQLLPDNKTVNRMPSFISERSETAENLRNVYLDTRSRRGFSSMTRIDTQVPDSDAAAPTHLASPSLSVLSESSFVSIYGDRDGDRDGAQDGGGIGVDEEDGDDLLSQIGEMYIATAQGVDLPPLPRAGTFGTVSASQSRPEQQQRQRIVTPTRVVRSNSFTTAGPGVNHLNYINGMMDQGSPLQRLERNFSGSDVRVTEGQARPPRTKEEKREALRKVMTDAPVGKTQLDQALPPTPDTISTSTLRNYQDSNDRLRAGQEGCRPGPAAAAFQAYSPHDASPLDATSAPIPNIPLQKHQADLTTLSTYFGGRIPVLPRPRSAGATTVSRKKSGWGSDDDDDDDDDNDERASVSFSIDESDTHSLESSLDIWLREGWKSGGVRTTGRGGGVSSRNHASKGDGTNVPPNTPHVGTPQQAPTVSGRKPSGRTSPDLFSFPTASTGGGWDASALATGAYSSAANPALILAHAHALPHVHPHEPHDESNESESSLGLTEDLAPVHAALFATAGLTQAPPPPNRRSSLHASTGSAGGGSGPGSLLATPRSDRGKHRKSPVRGESRRGSSDAREIDAAPPAGTTSRSSSGVSAVATLAPSDAKKNHPPVSGHAPTRAKGLQNLFRRSLGTSSSSSSVSASVASGTSASDASTIMDGGPVTPSPVGVLTGSSGSVPASSFGAKPNVGIPSWIRRGSMGEDERSSGATPPPIMRNRAGTGGTSASGPAGTVDGRDKDGRKDEKAGAHTQAPSRAPSAAAGPKLSVNVTAANGARDRDGPTSSSLATGTTTGSPVVGEFGRSAGNAAGASGFGSGSGKLKWLSFTRSNSQRGKEKDREVREKKDGRERTVSLRRDFVQ